MKKRILATIILSLVLSLIFPALLASADILWEPDDSFYRRNQHRTTLVGRRFYANGEGGFISMKAQPGSERQVEGYPNGEIIFIQFALDHDGETWGIGYAQGWVRMDQLVPMYDQISFADDNRQNLHAFSGSIDPVLDAETIVFWTWPGSGEVVITHSPMRDNRELESMWLQPSSAYTDADGREWGLIPYFYASRNMWICISDPSNENIPAFNAAPMPDLIQPAAEVPPSEGLPLPVIIIILVIVLAGVTVVLIRVFWKKSKTE